MSKQKGLTRNITGYLLHKMGIRFDTGGFPIVKSGRYQYNTHNKKTTITRLK